jgi:hypothetical protein
MELIARRDFLNSNVSHHISEFFTAGKENNFDVVDLKVMVRRWYQKDCAVAFNDCVQITKQIVRR